jgi:electron transfer flavoprotein beta subunit
MMPPMHVAVCVKQIPDPAAPGRLDPETRTLVREGKFVMDDSDSYGVEMALQLVQAAGGGEVTVISMAPNREIKGVKDALAMGADKAIVVSDEALKGSDALSTAKVLAAAVRRAGDVDLVIAATESTDGYTGTTPVQLAALLDMPSVTFAKRVVSDGSKVTVERQTDEGYDEVESALPAVVTVTAGVVEPRYPSFKAIMAAKNKPCEVVGLGDLGLEAGQVGFAGARQEITDVVAAEERKAGDVVEDDGEAHLKIVSFLENLKVI